MNNADQNADQNENIRANNRPACARVLFPSPTNDDDLFMINIKRELDDQVKEKSLFWGFNFREGKPMNSPGSVVTEWETTKSAPSPYVFKRW